MPSSSIGHTGMPQWQGTYAHTGVYLFGPRTSACLYRYSIKTCDSLAMHCVLKLETFLCLQFRSALWFYLSLLKRAFTPFTIFVNWICTWVCIKWTVIDSRSFHRFLLALKTSLQYPKSPTHLHRNNPGLPIFLHELKARFCSFRRKLIPEGMLFGLSNVKFEWAWAEIPSYDHLKVNTDSQNST